MAAIRVSSTEVVFVSRDTLITFPIGGSSCQLYKNEKPHIPDEKTGQPKGIEEGSLKILACGFSWSGDHFVTCDDYKQVTLWRVKDDPSWTVLSSRSSVRRVTSVTFTRDDTAVLVADKSGDVYRFSVTEPRDEGRIVLGHVSMLLDLVLVSKDRLIVTCDRDEKIRVSHYPNAHSILCYCLGHTEFVSQVVYVEDEDVIISGSGDGTLRVWDYQNGQQIGVTDCSAHLADHVTDPETATDNEIRNRNLRKEHQDGSTRNTNGVDLKRLVCCRHRKIIAVGFDRLSVILIYKYTRQSSDPNCMTLTFLQEVDLGADFWDMTFDTGGRLWTMQARGDGLVQVYWCGRPDNKLTALKADDDEEGVLTTALAVCQKWHLFKECVGEGGLFSVLHKARVDNAHFYRERKQQRLEEQKQRYQAKKERKRASKQVAPPDESKGDQSTKPPQVAPSTEDTPESKMRKTNA